MQVLTTPSAKAASAIYEEAALQQRARGGVWALLLTGWVTFTSLNLVLLKCKMGALTAHLTGG